MNGAMRTVSSLVSVGCSIVITFGLLSKMIQVLRFINIDYPYRLEIAFKTWNTNVPNIAIPEQIDEKIVSHDIHPIFTTYGVEPSFLSNFWGVIIIILTMTALWMICKGLLYYFESYHDLRKTLTYKVIKNLSKAALNSLVVSIYGGFSDVIFYAVLEMKSLLLGSAWSGVSLALAIFFILLGVCFICVHWNFLLKYRKLRLQSSTASPQALEELTRSYKALEVLYEDFSDTSIFKHGFLFIGVARDTIINLIITTLTSQPLLQTILLSCCSIFMCLYLMFDNPFRDRFGRTSQIFLELCVFIAYMSTLSLAVLDSHHRFVAVDRDRLGLVIIIMNMVINSGCALLLLINILRQAWEAYKAYSEKKSRKVHVESSGPPDLSPNNCTAVDAGQKERVALANRSLPEESVPDYNSSQIHLQQTRSDTQRLKTLEESVISTNTYNDENKALVPRTNYPAVSNTINLMLPKRESSSKVPEAQNDISSSPESRKVKGLGGDLHQKDGLEISSLSIE